MRREEGEGETKSLKTCISLLIKTTAWASAGNLHVCPCVTVNQLSFPFWAGESMRTKGQSRKGSHGGRGEPHQATKKARKRCGQAGVRLPGKGTLAGGRGGPGDSPQERGGSTLVQGRAAPERWPFEGTMNFFNQLISAVTKTPHLSRLVLGWNWRGVIDKCLNLGSTLGKKYLSTGSSNIIMGKRHILRALLPIQFGVRSWLPSWSPQHTLTMAEIWLSFSRGALPPQMRQLSGN